MIKVGVGAFLILISISSSLASASNPHLHEKHMAMREDPATHFGAWVETHAKTYASDVEEMARRLAIWTENLDYIIAYNAKHTSHWLGVNGSMADLTHDEYRKHLGYKGAAKKALQLKSNSKSFKYANVDKSKLPPAIDWRANGAVTPGKKKIKCFDQALLTLASLSLLQSRTKPSVDPAGPSPPRVPWRAPTPSSRASSSPSLSRSSWTATRAMTTAAQAGSWTLPLASS